MLRSMQVTLAVVLLLCAACSESRRAPGLVEGMNPGECSDGADNDADGRFDCGDSDCAGAPVCADGSVPTDTGTVADTGAPPSDSGPAADSGDPRPDTSVAPMCMDASGTWGTVTDCPLLPAGEEITISRISECEFSVSAAMASGTATADGSEFTIMVTSPAPVTCTGTYSSDTILTNCLGCATELQRR